MTKLGELRQRYSREVELQPSRFADEGKTYRAWAARADRYMAWVDAAERVGDAVEMTGELLTFADIRTEIVGRTRTGSCDLNAGPWKIAPGVEKWFVSLTADGREFKVYMLADRAAALAWVAETCGEVAWEVFGA